MTPRSWSQRLGALVAATLLTLSLATLTGAPANADVPQPPVTAPFTAPSCAGQTTSAPTANTGYAVVDLTQVFGGRLASYNAGHVVPLYDAFGGSVLLTDAGVNTGDAAYPPLCATRYVESLGTAVSEWMFCTDRLAQTCGDTDAAGNLVDHDGNRINPMTELPTNAKLSADQEKLIAYLVQHGHTYAGTGNQAWGGVTEARSELGTNERAALQTLVWCVSDPAGAASDFATTCANNMDAAEQARLLAMIPDVPELVLALTSTGTTLAIGDTARFTLTTNVFNQPIQLVTGGTATTNWTVCAGDATFIAPTLTVAGDNPQLTKVVTLCAEASTAGTATIQSTATPPSTQHVGWSQSINGQLAQACQVYAGFRVINKTNVTSNAQATFDVAPTATTEPSGELAPTGASGTPALFALALALLGVGGIAGASGILRARRQMS